MKYINKLIAVIKFANKVDMYFSMYPTDLDVEQSNLMEEAREIIKSISSLIKRGRDSEDENS